MTATAEPLSSPDVFRQVFEHAPVGIALLNAEPRDGGELVYANPTLCLISGRSIEELTGVRFGDTAPEAEREALMRVWRRVASDGETATVERRVVRPDGSVRWVEVTLFPVVTGDATRMVAAHAEDVTDRRNEARAADCRAAMTRAIAQTASVRGAMLAVMPALAKCLDFAFGAVWVPAHEDGEEILRCASVWQADDGDPLSFSEISHALPLAAGADLPGLAWQTGEVVTSADLGGDARCQRAPAAAADGLRGGLACRISAGSQPCGVLEFASESPGAPDGELRRLLEELAGDMTLMLADRQGQLGSGNTSLLLVEDNLVIARLVLEMLAASGLPLDPEHVGSLAEARDRVIASPPACVLLDLTLPDAEGLEALREITRVAPDVPVVVLSGIEDEATALQAVHEGAQDYLMKRKVDLQGLSRALRYAIERKGAQELLIRERLQDEVTGLPNRVLFADRLKVALDRSDARNVAVLVLNLDRFRMVNDTLGHHGGDRVLAEAARRLLELVPMKASLASFGGDEFAVLVEDAPPRALLDRAEALREALEIPYRVVEEEVRLTASAGVGCNPDADAETLLGEADAALSRAKKEGGARTETFQEAVRETLRERLRLERELRNGIEAGQLRLFYQPIVELRTGETVAFEALVRWEHPERGLVPPGDFLALAEERGLSRPLCDWVLNQACGQLATWRRELADWSGGTMHVNLSAADLGDDELPAQVERTLADAGVPADAVCLEVTETALIRDLELSGQILARLKAIGAAIALDDFGTGFSSLSYLERFPIDMLKLDRSFVASMRSHGRPAIVAAVASMGRGLRLPVVAEGVEEAEEAARLREFGYDLAQGFLFARPLPAQQAAAAFGDDRQAGRA